MQTFSSLIELKNLFPKETFLLVLPWYLPLNCKTMLRKCENKVKNLCVGYNSAKNNEKKMQSKQKHLL